jgi:hypothetical protein
MSAPTIAVDSSFKNRPRAGTGSRSVPQPVYPPLVHPVLARLEYLQWIDSAWDGVPLGQHARTRRRHYFLTADGVVAARQSLAEAFADRHTPTGFPKPLRGMT